MRSNRATVTPIGQHNQPEQVKLLVLPKKTHLALYYKRLQKYQKWITAIYSCEGCAIVFVSDRSSWQTRPGF